MVLYWCLPFPFPLKFAPQEKNNHLLLILLLFWSNECSDRQEIYLFELLQGENGNKIIK